MCLISASCLLFVFGYYWVVHYLSMNDEGLYVWGMPLPSSSSFLLPDLIPFKRGLRRKETKKNDPHTHPHAPSKHYQQRTTPTQTFPPSVPPSRPPSLFLSHYSRLLRPTPALIPSFLPFPTTTTSSTHSHTHIHTHRQGTVAQHQDIEMMDTPSGTLRVAFVVVFFWFPPPPQIIHAGLLFQHRHSSPRGKTKRRKVSHTAKRHHACMHSSLSPSFPPLKPPQSPPPTPPLPEKQRRAGGREDEEGLV